ncbi:MAG: hypothetical protein R6V31_07170 [Halohasta sp.]
MDRQSHHDDPSTTSPHSADSIGRRRLLTAAGTAAVVGLAGCAGVANSIAELALGEVNLFNETGQQIAGSITVTDPEGSTVLDETFEIEPDSDDEDGEADETDGTESYSDVFAEAGSYTVAAELDDDSAVSGDGTIETDLDVADPEEEHIIVVFGVDDFEGEAGAFVIEEFTDIGDHVDD